MSTPAMLAARWAHTLFLAFWFLVISSLVVSRAYIFYEAVVHENNVRERERQLLQNCEDPEFYTMLAQHTAICTAVLDNARTSVYAKAFKAVADNTHACGRTTCQELVTGALMKMGYQTLGIVLLCVIATPNFVFILMQLMQQRGAREHERRLYDRHSRHGLAYYQKMDDVYDDEPHSSLRRRRPLPVETVGAKQV